MLSATVTSKTSSLHRFIETDNSKTHSDGLGNNRTTKQAIGYNNYVKNLKIYSTVAKGRRRDEFSTSGIREVPNAVALIPHL